MLEDLRFGTTRNAVERFTGHFFLALVAIVAASVANPAHAQTVTYQTFAEGKATSDTNSLPVNIPPGTVQGDLLIAAVATDGNNGATLVPPSGQGWTLISRTQQTSVTFGVWWKTAGASEPSSHTFSWSASEQAYGWIMRFSGQDVTNPIHVFSTSGSTASLPSSPSVTTTVANTLILRLGGFDGASVTVDSTGLSGHTTITMDRSSTNDGFAASGGAGFVQQASAGSSGGSNFALTASRAYRTVTLAIAPFTCSTGAECADGNPCTDDVCTSGVCSNPNNTASCSDGDPCTANDTCSAGACVSGGPVNCTGQGGDCNTASCDPGGADGNCDTLTPVSNGTSCDLGPCTIGEFCTSGVCGGGAPRNCSAFGDQCNDASCDPGGPEANCNILTPKTNGTPCDDVLACNIGETCQAGICTGGGPPDCSGAGDDCNTASCNTSGAEGNCDILTPVSNGTSCDLGACTVGEFCTGGICGGGAPRDCSAFGNQCNTASCDPGGAEANCTILTPKANGTPCDDLLACNVGESCQAGVCTSGGPPDCSGAGDQCNTASCNTSGAQGNCDTLTPVANGTGCDDGLFCTDTDTCQGGTCTGTGDPCVAQLCDEGADACVDCLDPGDCDDADPCTTNNCNVGLCEFPPNGSVTVDLEVQGIGTATSRDVTFVITNCSGGADPRVETVAFDSSGMGSANIAGVDAASSWISAREGHTLRRLAPLSFAACAATVDLTGASALEAGDFQGGVISQDNLVEISDFSILASQWNVAIDPTFSTGADATGDGLQGIADFTAIQTNFLLLGDGADGCSSALAKRPDERLRGSRRLSELDILVRGGATRVPTARLRIPNASRADVNDDGVVDVRDIRLFARQNALPLDPIFNDKLEKIERAERRVLRR